MKIQFQQTIKTHYFSDLFNAGIHRAQFPGDDFDYFAYITIFGREWYWYIYK